jgi:hypothetical protein
MADQLTKLGFIVDKVGNADSFGYDTTVIREHSKVTGIGERLRRDLALKTAAVTPAPAASASAAPEATDATIIVGRDFVTAMTSQPGTKTP